jgi:hypothetical protein
MTNWEASVFAVNWLYLEAQIGLNPAWNRLYCDNSSTWHCIWTPYFRISPQRLQVFALNLVYSVSLMHVTSSRFHKLSLKFCYLHFPINYIERRLCLFVCLLRVAKTNGSSSLLGTVQSLFNPLAIFETSSPNIRFKFFLLFSYRASYLPSSNRLLHRNSL